MLRVNNAIEVVAMVEVPVTQKLEEMETLVVDAFAKTAVPLNVGLAEKTSEPVPVSLVTAVIKFALEGVPRKSAIPAARPLTPVEIGSPVAFVRVADEGVPRAGVTRVGDVAKTRAPLPVSFVTIAAISADVSISVETITSVSRYDSSMTLPFHVPADMVPK